MYKKVIKFIYKVISLFVLKPLNSKRILNLIDYIKN